jgi:hypothetical protein
MKMNPFGRTFGTTLLGMFALGAGLGFGSQAQADGSHARFEGTWINDVQILACAPAPPIVFASFQSVSTHMVGGTLVEGGAPAGPPPGVSRSPGQGIWRRTSAHRFNEFFRFSNFDDLGRLVSIVEVTSRARLIHGDNPDTAGVVEPYYLKGEGTNRITNLNPVDGSVINVTEGCSKATAAPMLFED